MEKLIKGKRYLIRYGFLGELTLISVLNVTDCAYNIKYENGNTTWIEINRFNGNYFIIEDISDHAIEYVTEQKDKCIVCDGTGIILLDNKISTSTNPRTIPCPLCH